MKSSKIEVSNCTFINNSAVGHGGALYIWESFVGVSKSEFNNNIAGNSGGVIFAVNQAINITGSDFNNNKADEGGSIYWECIDSKSVMIMNGCQFVTNTADDIGGAIMILYGKVTITLGQFSNNNAGGGGAIYIYTNAALNVVENEVSGSRTISGGGFVHYIIVL